MNLNDPVGDLITRIRNAQLRGRSKLVSPASTLRMRVLQVLKDEGYVRDFQVSKDGAKSVLEIALKYFEGRPAIDKIDRVSRSGLRVYRGKDKLPKVMGGLGIAIVSTPGGIMSDTQARAKGVGGEVIGTVA